MPKFSEFKANDAQSEVRKVITDNFKIATNIPEDKTNNNNKLFALVGVASSGDQQLLHAKDGVDYLSPETGLMKNGGDQVINGKITANGLTISDGGAIIADHLYVYDTNAEGAPSFTVSKNKAAVSYGTFEAKGAATFGQKLTVNGGIVSTGATNTLGTSNFSTIGVSGTGTIANLSSTSAVIGSANIKSGLDVGGPATLKGILKVEGQVTMNNRVVIPNPGDISVVYARPLRAVNRKPNNGEVAYGTLWGQY